MKTSKKILSTVIAIPLLIGSVSALAGGHKEGEGHKKHKGVPHGMQYLLKGVELTEEQKNKVKEINKKNRLGKEERVEKQAKAKEMRETVNKFLLAESFDENAVRELAKKSVDDMVEYKIKNIRKQHEILSILTKEQKAQVQKNMDEMGKKHPKKDKK